MSLRFKLFLPLMIFSALLAAYVFSFWIPTTIAYVEKSYHASLANHLASIAEAIAPHLVRGQPYPASVILDTLLKKNPEWESIELSNVQGRPVYLARHTPNPPTKRFSEVRLLEQPVSSAGMTLGKIVLKVDFAPQLSLIRAQQQELIITSVMVMLIFSLVIGLTIEILVRRPLSSLAHASDKLAKGDFGTPLPAARQDEVGTLVHSFSAMRGAMRYAQEKLVDEIAERRTAQQQLHLTASRLVALLGNLQAGTLVEDERGTVVIVNQRYFKMFKVAQRVEDFIGKHSGPLKESAQQLMLDPDHFSKRTREIIDTRVAITGEEMLLIDMRIYERDYVPIFLKNEYVGHLWQYRDITERKRAEAALFQEKERAQVTLQSIGDGVVTADSMGNIEYLNPAAELISGCNLAQVRGQPLVKVFNIVYEGTNQAVPDPVSSCLQGLAIPRSSANTVLVRDDGSRLAVEHSASPIRDRDGRVVGVVLVLHDDSQARNMAHQLSWQASHDPLTGLYNRRKFEQCLEELLQSARMQRLQHALLYLDLDQFKIVNDTCAHFAGDELLRQISALLQSMVRDTDTLARLGGDEFGVLLSGCPPERALAIANTLREAILDYRFAWQGNHFSIGVSIGLVNIDAHSETITGLLSAADTACYAAKDKGRNRVQVYEPQDDELQQRHGEMQWVSRIHDAFSNNSLCLYVQPMVSLTKNEAPVSHCEILLRMKDAQGGMLPPMAFIPAAERYSLMPAIDRWVVETLFSKLKMDPALVKAPNLYAINLSGTSLNDESFLDFILTQFRDRGVPPQRICFEITETAAIANMTKAIHFMGTLKKLGCCFSLDDFGSGLSSFIYLKTLPVDYLKIDGSFVKDIVTDPVSKAMVESINQVGHVMGIQTIAEYAETPEIIVVLRELGVDFAQGYAIARPQPF